MSRLPDQWIEKIFERMADLYGTAFAAKWHGLDTERIKYAWSETLGEFTGDQIKGALEDCAKECKYPPSLPEFYQLCKNKKVMPMHQKLLPKLHEKNTETGMNQIEKIKSMLRLKNVA